MQNALQYKPIEKNGVEFGFFKKRLSLQCNYVFKGLLNP